MALISACAKQAQPQKDITKTTESTPKAIVLRTDNESIRTGKILFLQKCESCHDPYSTMTLSGPGLKGILKSPLAIYINKLKPFIFPLTIRPQT